MKVNIGKGIELDVDANALPANVMEHVVYIGLRNILMDSHASITTESDGDNMVANARATAEKKLAAMFAGEVRVAGTREGDPVRAEAVRIASERVKAALRKAGRKVSDIDAKALRAKAQFLLTTDAGNAIMELARERVAQVKAVEADTDYIDLADL